MKPTLIPNTKILIVGEAPGEQEMKQGICFVGYFGKELDGQLADAGIDRSQVSLTNVFFERPEGNEISAWCLPKKEAMQGLRPDLPWREIRGQKGILPASRVQSALRRLYDEILYLDPNVIVPLGNTALQALCGVSGITKLRGAIHFASIDGKEYKVVPTYHPAGVLRNYDWRPAVVADFMKVKLEAKSKDANLFNRSVYVEPSISDLVAWRSHLSSAEYLAVDIETKSRQITCVGFAPHKDVAYVIPFWSAKTGDYWKTVEEEREAFKVVRDICASDAIKIFQNGMYDLTYLSSYGIFVKNAFEDTMLMHHSLFPALPKGLDFLGSIYCNERSWKRWRVRGGDTHELKRDE